MTATGVRDLATVERRSERHPRYEEADTADGPRHPLDIPPREEGGPQSDERETPPAPTPARNSTARLPPARPQTSGRGGDLAAAGGPPHASTRPTFGTARNRAERCDAKTCLSSTPGPPARLAVVPPSRTARSRDTPPISQVDLAHPITRRRRDRGDTPARAIPVPPPSTSLAPPRPPKRDAAPSPCTSSRRLPSPPPAPSSAAAPATGRRPQVGGTTRALAPDDPGGPISVQAALALGRSHPGAPTGRPSEPSPLAARAPSTDRPRPSPRVSCSSRRAHRREAAPGAGPRPATAVRAPPPSPPRRHHRGLELPPGLRAPAAITRSRPTPPTRAPSTGDKTRPPLPSNPSTTGPPTAAPGASNRRTGHPSSPRRSSHSPAPPPLPRRPDAASRGRGDLGDPALPAHVVEASPPSVRPPTSPRPPPPRRCAPPLRTPPPPTTPTGTSPPRRTSRPPTPPPSAARSGRGGRRVDHRRRHPGPRPRPARCRPPRTPLAPAPPPSSADGDVGWAHAADVPGGSPTRDRAT